MNAFNLKKKLESNSETLWKYYDLRKRFNKNNEK